MGESRIIACFELAARRKPGPECQFSAPRGNASGHGRSPKDIGNPWYLNLVMYYGKRSVLLFAQAPDIQRLWLVQLLLQSMQKCIVNRDIIADSKAKIAKARRINSEDCRRSCGRGVQRSSAYLKSNPRMLQLDQTARL